MSGSSEYTPPKVWTWDKPSGGRCVNIRSANTGAGILATSESVTA